MNVLIESVAKAMAKADGNNDFWKQYVPEAIAGIKAVRSFLAGADTGIHFASMDLLDAELATRSSQETAGE